MVIEEVTASYKKPFNLFHYNKPKQPPLRRRKEPIDFKAQPKVPVRLTNATRLRDKVIKEYMNRSDEPYEAFREGILETRELITQEPEIVPRDTRTTQYRYKWAREVPVVSCRFTEHVMMYRKPPFTFDRVQSGCGRYRLRNLEIKDPEREEIEPEEEKLELAPSILM